MNTLRPFNFSEPIQGVQVKPLSEDGKSVRIRYKGLLAGSGSDFIMLHGGYGNAQSWDNITEKVMEHTHEGWEQNIYMEKDQFNFCFKDSVGNWDNNNSLNWIYRIS